MVRSIRQLEALRDEWDALAAPFESPLLDHDWFTSCAEAFHSGEDLQIRVEGTAGLGAGHAIGPA
jgi:predicted N-acyltransferase